MNATTLHLLAERWLDHLHVLVAPAANIERIIRQSYEPSVPEPVSDLVADALVSGHLAPERDDDV